MKRATYLKPKHEWRASQQCHRSKIFDGVISEIAHQRRRERVSAGVGEAERVTVRLSTRHGLGTPISAGADAILDDKLLSEAFA